MTAGPGRLAIEGLGSIRRLELDLASDVTVPIGANGSGESNLVSAPELVPRTWDDSFRGCPRRRGGASNPLLEGDEGRADRIRIGLTSEFDEEVGRNGYRVELRPDAVHGSDQAELHEWLLFQAGRDRERPFDEDLGLGARSRVRRIAESGTSGGLRGFAAHVRPIPEGCRILHFDDVSGHAPVEGRSTAGDDVALRSDAGSIAAHPPRAQREHPGHHRRIVSAISHVRPCLRRLRPAAGSLGTDQAAVGTAGAGSHLPGPGGR